MKIQHDAETDSAYVTLVDHVSEGAAVTQVEVAPPGEIGRIILDFDAAGRLLGVEILGASVLLPRSET